MIKISNISCFSFTPMIPFVSKGNQEMPIIKNLYHWKDRNSAFEFHIKEFNIN